MYSNYYPSKQNVFKLFTHTTSTSSTIKSIIEKYDQSNFVVIIHFHTQTSLHLLNIIGPTLFTNNVALAFNTLQSYQFSYINHTSNLILNHTKTISLFFSRTLSSIKIFIFLKMDNLPKCPANYTTLTPLTFLMRASASYANRPSVIHEGTQFTWSQTYDRCRRLASSLRALNISKNDVVSLHIKYLNI
jgi:hypothetical protein